MSFGVNVTQSVARPSIGSSIETSTAFVVGPASGDSSDGPVVCYSISDFVAACAPRTDATTAPSYDWIDNFFNEQGGLGGGKVIFAKAGITGSGEVEVDAGLAVLNDPTLGPGQLAIVGTPITPAIATDLQTHCIANNRVALRDVNNGETTAQQVIDGNYAPTDDTYGATFGSWVEIPAPLGVIGASYRYVPASSTIAALCARVDANGNVNTAAAGQDYPINYASGFVSIPNAVDRAALMAAGGVNQFAIINNILQGYGFRTAQPFDPNNPFWQFNCSRARMYLKAQLDAVGQAYMFKTLDGAGHLLTAFQGDLQAVCKAFYDVDGLYGDTPQDAYSVNVGVSVNTGADAAAGQLNASIQAVLSMHTESVNITDITVPIGGSVN
jgi:hypothetical protein